jgi:TPR repeat protein
MEGLRQNGGANEEDPMFDAEIKPDVPPLPTPDMSGDELFRLGMLYSTGQGGAPVDLVSAHMLFNLASMRGSEEARLYRRELSQEMEREDVAEAQRAARRWLDAGRVALSA